MEDDELYRKLREGDKSAYALLVVRYNVRILNLCYRFLLDKQDAEDLSQEIFIEVFQSIHSFRRDSSLSTWIYRIAVSKCLDEIKKRKRLKRFSEFGKLLHLDEIAHWVGGGPMPDKALINKDKMQEMKQALNKLPENQRVAFTLSKIDGYSNPEIASIMNTTTVAVESLVYRARKKLEEELKEILKKK
ncbi:MAG: RNA polymerase sigma factor [Bacteroidota bacterium]